MRKALIVGIDYYESVGNLSGCVNDAYSVKTMLERHADGTINFAMPQLLIGTGPSQSVSRSELKSALRDLFSDDSDIALFYFSGHGYIEDAGGYLCTSECQSGDDGVSLVEIMQFANSSRARNKVILLDSCHSGVLGNNSLVTGLAEIREGVTILTASTESQYALETGGSGVFTTLLVDALGGAAANLVGSVTPGSAYAHIDQSLGPWAQRPVFKTNVKSFVSLRETKPPIAPDDLRALPSLFPAPQDILQLDPSYEPERTGNEDSSVPPPDPINTARFRVLQNLAKVNLVRPVEAPHMWHAAMQSKGCELTALGQHYWNLVEQGLI